jgi:hypothetical protein
LLAILAHTNHARLAIEGERNGIRTGQVRFDDVSDELTPFLQLSDELLVVDTGDDEVVRRFVERPTWPRADLFAQ